MVTAVIQVIVSNPNVLIRLANLHCFGLRLVPTTTRIPGKFANTLAFRTSITRPVNPESVGAAEFIR